MENHQKKFWLARQFCSISNEQSYSIRFYSNKQSFFMFMCLVWRLDVTIGLNLYIFLISLYFLFILLLGCSGINPMSDWHRRNFITLIYIWSRFGWLPDNATRSLVFSPTAENLAVMLVKPSTGEGIEELAPAWFAVKLSLLPSSTLHDGPPCFNHKDIYI